MTREEAYKKLDEVFQDVFDDDTIHVNDDTMKNVGEMMDIILERTK